MSVARRLLWPLSTGLVVVALVLAPARDRGPVPLLLLGPFAELAAQVQWLRFQAASLHGEEGRALELAESALSLDPRAPEGWQKLAAHLVFDLASREREPDLARRRAWFRSGLAVLARGARSSSAPESLATFEGLVLLGKASSDPALDPGGAPALEAAGIAALERAAGLGDRRAGALAAQLRAERGE